MAIYTSSNTRGSRGRRNGRTLAEDATSACGQFAMLGGWISVGARKGDTGVETLWSPGVHSEPRWAQAGGQSRALADEEFPKSCHYTQNWRSLEIHPQDPGSTGY